MLQALVLAQVHKLSIWYRPEPKRNNISRRPTQGERFLANTLHLHLQYMADNSTSPVMLRVQTGVFEDEVLICKQSENLGHDPDPINQLDLTLYINTPQFYRWVISYPTLHSSLKYALLDPHEENQTVFSDDPGSLLNWVEANEHQRAFGMERNATYFDVIVQFLWRIYLKVRKTNHLKGVYPHRGPPKARNAALTQLYPCSPSPQNGPTSLDIFVASHCSPLVQLRYMLAVLHLQWRGTIMHLVGGE